MKRFRGLLITVMVLTLLLAAVPVCAARQTIQVVNDGSQITVKVNGSQVKFDQPPRISNGRTLVPLRNIAGALGFKVNWDAGTKKVTINGTRTVELIVNAAVATVDGNKVLLDVPAVISGGRVMVPLRFVGEALGAQISYITPTKPAAQSNY